MNPQAPNNDSSAASDLSRVQALLPLHAQGLLQGEQLTFMHDWLEHNMAQYPEMKAELAWLGTTSTQLKEESAKHVRAAQPQLDAGLNSLMGRIAAEQASLASGAAPVPRRAAPEQKNWIAEISDWFSRALGAGSRGFAMGAAVLVLGQAGVIGALLVNEPAQQTVLSGEGNTTAGNAAAGDAVTALTVAFNPTATESEISQALIRAKAQLISGPSALGLYSVSVPTAQLDDSVATLRAATEVVESVTR
jgi:hypothetical protein